MLYNMVRDSSFGFCLSVFCHDVAQTGPGSSGVIRCLSLAIGSPGTLRSMEGFPAEEPCSWIAFKCFQFVLKTCRP